MPVKKAKKNQVSREVSAKAKKVLAFVRQKAKECTTSAELMNSIYDPTGKATLLFPTEAERAAYLRTPESRQVAALIASLPSPEPNGVVDMRGTANGAITIQLPRSVHAALLAEAKEEGVSLDQLCASKLVAQLRDVV